MLSYWEQKTWLKNIDYTIVGSGIVGLHTALRLRERYPAAKILILEKGILPSGASTKNAGFACFGSVSELLSDLKNQRLDEVVQLVEKRYLGLEKLRKNLGDHNIGFEKVGGYELFLPEDSSLLYQCQSEFESLNQALYGIFKKPIFSLCSAPISMKGILNTAIQNEEEGQIDTGTMMKALLDLAYQKNILILNSVSVNQFETWPKNVVLATTLGEIYTRFLFIATNGFAGNLFPEEVKPARAQVLITKPIEGLTINGTFHLQEGYYYFRTIDQRILLGGGRNLDFEGETTTDMQLHQRIQDTLTHLLNNVILPDKNVEIEQRWSGIMGVGAQKKPLIKKINDRIFAGVRLGGMGVALGSWVGTELANLMDDSQ